MRSASMIATLLLLAFLMGCNSSNASSFGQEREVIERSMPAECRLLSSVGVQRNSERTEASWQYQMSGSPDSIKNVLRSTFNKRYQTVHEDANGLSFARFDGADSFYLTFSLQARGKDVTAINVALTGMPD